MKSLEERLMGKVDYKDNGCWIFTGAKTSTGYGNIRFGDKNYVAHRISYLLFVGGVAPGLDLDHLCRDRACVNPEHLEPVTRRENLLRGETVTATHASKTHCPQGHEYTTDNTVVYYGSRYCLACRKIKNDIANEKRKRNNF